MTEGLRSSSMWCPTTALGSTPCSGCTRMPMGGLRRQSVVQRGPGSPLRIGLRLDHGDPWTREFWKWVGFLDRGISMWMATGLTSMASTQTHTLGDVGARNGYDQSRVDILFDYGNHVWSNHPGSCVLSSSTLGTIRRRRRWPMGGFSCGASRRRRSPRRHSVTAGTSARASWQARGWNWPNLVGYFESHDEQRIAHDLLLYGNASGGYDTKALGTAMDRLAMAHAFLFTLPGPKMMYQWGEFGYDVSIYDCLNGTFAEGCN